MKKFNIRKVLDGLTAASSSSSSSHPGNRENDSIQENLQSEHFQLCKVGSYHTGGRRGWPRANGTPAARYYTLETECTDGSYACGSNKIDVHVAIEQVTSLPNTCISFCVDSQVDPSHQEVCEISVIEEANSVVSDVLLRISKKYTASYLLSQYAIDLAGKSRWLTLANRKSDLMEMLRIHSVALADAG